MNYDFSEEAEKLFEAIRSIAATAPAEEDLAGATVDTISAALREMLKALAETGYLQDGRDDDTPEGAVNQMAAMETLAGQARSLFLAVEMSTRVLGRALARWGTGAAQEQWREGLLQGQWIGALALSEEAMNVQNDPLATVGSRKNGHIVVSGGKHYVINAPLADKIGVVGLLEDRPAIFMLDAGADGLSISEPVPTMGYDGIRMADVTLDACVLPEENVLHPPEGTPVLDLLRQWENEVLMAAALGMMQAAFTEARDFAKSHRSGGKPVIAYQEVGFKLSEMLTLYQTAQLLAYRAVWTLKNQPKEGASLIWCAKVFATEAAERVAGEALRILAGQGYRAGSASESAYRAAKWTQIGGMSTEIARVRIGDQALGYAPGR